MVVSVSCLRRFMTIAIAEWVPDHSQFVTMYVLNFQFQVKVILNYMYVCVSG